MEVQMWWKKTFFFPSKLKDSLNKTWILQQSILFYLTSNLWHVQDPVKFLDIRKTIQELSMWPCKNNFHIQVELFTIWKPHQQNWNWDRK
jgi:hypothetical protein